MNAGEWKKLSARFESLQPSWQTAAVCVFDFFLISFSWHLWDLGHFLTGVVSILLLSLALLHAYLILHEATHSAVSRNAALNHLAGSVAGWMIFMPYFSRRRSHLLHHLWTGHPKGDPANERIIRRFSVMTKKQADQLEFIWKSWLPLLTLNDRIGMWLDPFQRIRSGEPASKYKREIQSAYLYGFFYFMFFVALIGTGTLGHFLAWYLPALTLQFFFEELANLPHHAETPLLKETDPALPYYMQDQVTHSCRSLPIWSRFVLLNFNLHTAHHFFPWIPWNGLPAVHQEIKKFLPELEQSQRTRNELLWSLKNRKRPLLEIMGHYFDKTSAPKNETAQIQSPIARGEAQINQNHSLNLPL